MPLIYDTNQNVFFKKEYSKYSGNLINKAKDACTIESPMQSFWINHFINTNQYDNLIFSFDTPSYYTQGGTLNYYGQDFTSIFTNVSKPFIKYTFTANTSNFGTGTTIKHNIYKISYKEYQEYTAEIKRKTIEKTNDYKTEETVVNTSGNSSTVLTTKKITSSNTYEKLSPNFFPEDVGNYDLNFSDKLKIIEEKLKNPILTITATTSGLTTSNYFLNLDEFQKVKGSFNFQLFEDYSQYFITTQFEFYRERGVGLCDFYQLDDYNNLISEDYEQHYKEITPTNNHIITGGTFSGITVNGNFFTYFLMPNKPKWESPYVTGLLTTFSPTFYWSHVDDGDSFLIQVVYDYADSQSFSGTIYTYQIGKEETNLSTDEMLNSQSGDWSITQKTTDVTRKYSIPLLREKDFWYRVGNVKELVNLFGVKQKVVTFSDIMSATTSPNPYNNFVYVQPDSPFTEEITVLTHPSYLEDSIPEQYSLSGVVSGSVVNNATMQLIFPNSNYITQATDSIGNYLFTNLEAGTYTLNTFYRGYKQDSKIINITGNTTSSFRISLIWGNKYDTWGQFGNELPLI